jgi:hypothetical protein
MRTLRSSTIPGFARRRRRRRSCVPVRLDRVRATVGVVEVTCKAGAERSLIRSVELLQLARNEGDVTLKRTNILKCRFV